MRRIIGSDAHAHRGVLRLSRPLEHGAVSDWSDAERLWRHALGSSGIRAESGRHPILVTERALTSRPHREALVTQLFEEQGAPAVAVAGQAPLALYGTSATTGLVVDAGEGCITAVPVYEGVSLPHATGRADIGGRDVTAQLMRLLRVRGLPLSSSAEAELAREIKEATSRVALDPRAAEAEAAEGKSAEGRYRLPDGRVLTVGAERFRAPELLFDPSVGGMEAPGVGVLAAGAVLRADVDTRSALLGGVLLCGGASKCPGFGARLLREMRGLSPKGSKIRIKAPKERELLPWVGGSILAALSSFRGRWVSKQEFDEEGVRVVHKKALG